MYCSNWLDILRPNFPKINITNIWSSSNKLSAVQARIVAVRPINPKSYKLTDESRMTIGELFLPEWVDRTAGAQGIFCVPLIWARPYRLPQGHELEAWYIWNGQEETTDWRTSPNALLADKDESQVAAHQAALIYDASIELSDRKYRLACTGLLSSLRESGHRRMWTTAEGQSFSIWTDFAFQSWHGSFAQDD
jgi:hypothetical protein